MTGRITLGFGIEMFNRQFGVTPKEFEQQMTKLRRTANSQEAETGLPGCWHAGRMFRLIS